MRQRNLASVLGLLATLAGSAVLMGADATADRAARIEQVRAAEIAFAKAVMDDKPEAFAALLDPGTVFVSGKTVTRGKADVIAGWKGFFGPDRPYFEWHPDVVELSADGSLGLSRGPWVIRDKDKDGKPIEIKGLYNSIWQRQADGSWRIIFDAGCSPCPACG
ncbi:MAG: nuclear transport factor 2 family protein [Thermoanaerobaculia bacterium]